MRSLYSKMCCGKRSMKYNTKIILSCKCQWDSKISYWSSQQDKDPKEMSVFLFRLQWSNHVISGQGQLSLWLLLAITHESAWWCFVWTMSIFCILCLMWIIQQRSWGQQLKGIYTKLCEIHSILPAVPTKYTYFISSALNINLFSMSAFNCDVQNLIETFFKSYKEKKYTV